MARELIGLIRRRREITIKRMDLDRQNNGYLILKDNSDDVERDIVRLLDNGYNPNWADYAGVTPIQSALITKQFDMVELMISRYGGTVNNSNMKGQSPLMIATLNGLYESVDKIIQYGACTTDLFRGNTPYEAAVLCKYDHEYLFGIDNIKIDKGNYDKIIKLLEPHTPMHVIGSTVDEMLSRNSKHR